jgi:hypothetical protein
VTGNRFAIYILVTLLGVAVAYGLSLLANLLSSYLQAPVFLIVCAAWILIGWKYAMRIDDKYNKSATQI